MRNPYYERAVIELEEFLERVLSIAKDGRLLDISLEYGAKDVDGREYSEAVKATMPNADI